MNIPLSIGDMVVLETYRVLRELYPGQFNVTHLPERLRPIAEFWGW